MIERLFRWWYGPSKKELAMAYALKRLCSAIEDDCNSCGAGGQDCDGCVKDARLTLIKSALESKYYLGTWGEGRQNKELEMARAETVVYLEYIRKQPGMENYSYEHAGKNMLAELKQLRKSSSAFRGTLQALLDRHKRGTLDLSWHGKKIIGDVLEHFPEIKGG